ncbi:MAG TPA: CU044_5270 family protein [Candidatus Limnocylindrales bacterium]|jgi:hypothetical protein|nr:CU044_5270 family protein [Candidatus Limnocylindrales bacterium]
MDELSMIRQLLDEPAPSPRVVEAGRQRLRRASTRSAGRIRRPQLWSALALGATGLAAAAVLAVTMLGSGGGSSPGAGPAVVIGGSARSVLLAAAVRAASAPTSGRYWHVRSMSRTTPPRTFGRDEDRYTLEQRSVTESWTTHAGRSWLGRRAWVFPKTARDVAAWRRDGAPSRWCIGRTDTAPPRPICLRTAPGSASLTRFGQDTFQIAEGHDLTFAQLQRLPTRAGALTAWLVRIARRDLDPSAGTAVVNLNVENELSNLLVDFPVPPGVRAAAFRALAGMPDVKSIGPVQDELGRPGVGIEIRSPHAVFVFGGGTVGARSGRLSRTLIIDPRTSRVLADQMRLGRSVEPAIDTLILNAGWTDRRPHRPEFPGAARRAGGTSAA